MGFVRLFILLFLFCPALSCFAQSGSGCLVNNTVYTQYLGMGTPYVGQPNQPYYNTIGPSLNLNENNSLRYICGAINEYPQGSYYDNTIPPFGATVIIPAQHELLSRNGVDCVISTTLNGSLAGSGKIATYQLNPPSSCSNLTNNVPIDDHIYVLFIFSTIFFGFSKCNFRKADA